MAPPSLPQPLDRLPEDRIPGLPRPALTAGAEGPHRSSDVTGNVPRPPGGERLGRLPGPQGLDRFASGDGPTTLVHSRAFDLAPTPRAVGNARRSVGELLDSWGVGEEARDNAVLVTSELVTNSIVHSAGRRIVCRVHAGSDRIRIEVEDQNGGFTLPAPRQARPDEQNGRGLFLVDALSLDWGVAIAPEGPSVRVVWAELSTAPDEPPTTPHYSGGPSTHGPSPHS
ncbi:anti-sigma regulatory factor (Ser/Thr protein kinase) [Streptomyces sp. Ag109_O5-1]|uniref:ATP-binding protein n=1 Tax=Streptomyces TaxID=1883 RepID=UPI000F4D5A17|nr:MULTISPECIES: ATP-binding protein [Streptomyces]RPE46423.1 anti-sigma regulatory factor (Ser/Thr protein kinase) [Streptomyces sp. Ag109_O5-1]